MKCTRNNDKTDLITADNNAYGLFWRGFQERQRFTKPGSAMAAAGFDPLAFGNAEVVLDGGVGGDSPANPDVFPEHGLYPLPATPGPEHDAARRPHQHKPRCHGEADLMGR